MSHELPYFVLKQTLILPQQLVLNLKLMLTLTSLMLTLLTQQVALSLTLQQERKLNWNLVMGMLLVLLY
jgi:hypothetical protein